MSSDAVEIGLREFVAENAGRRLPGERELSEKLGVPRTRLRTLLARLQAEGLVESRQGSGTYAVDPSVPRLRTVALLVDEELKLGEDPFFSQLFERLQGAAQEAGLNSLIHRIGRDGVAPAHYHDGAITLGRAGATAAPAARTVSVVALMPGSRVRPGLRVSVVHLDDFGAGQDAATILIDQGRRTILFAGRGDVEASRDRYRGVTEVCAARGVEVRQLEISLNYVAGLAAGRALDLTGIDSPGLIAMNDWLAVGLRGGLASRAAAADLPIVSFDGLPIAEEPSLDIRSLSVPIAQIARDAVVELQRLSGTQASTGRVLTYRLEG